MTYITRKRSVYCSAIRCDDNCTKSINKRALQQHFSLPSEEDVPVIAIVSRLTKQKGLDLVKCVFHEMIAENVQMIILGTGEWEFEHFFHEMALTYPERVRVYIGFSEQLAHQIYAGADMFLMPSKFEPCGLGQMIAMRYGAVPIVRETGGLNDTVQSFNEFTKEGTGFTFKTLMHTTCYIRFNVPVHFMNKKKYGK